MNYRPGPDGKQRKRRTYYATKHENRFENVRWYCKAGLVHQASWHHNRTLCEMGSNAFIELLHLVIDKPTLERVNCIGCMGYITWHDYPID